MEIVLAVGIGVGLASVAGLRAFAPLFFTALLGVLGVLVLPEPYGGLSGEWPVVGGLGALAVLEAALDKLRALERAFNYAMVPVRAAGGAVLFAVSLGEGIGAAAAPWLVAGAAVAGVVAVLKVVLRPPARVASAGVSAAFLSVLEDLAGVAGSLVGIFVPYLPVLLVAFLLYFYHRLKRRRGRKYGGLRILSD